jgi:hypothetical protein
VQIGGVVRQPYGAWMTQVARNFTLDNNSFGSTRGPGDYEAAARAAP